MVNKWYIPERGLDTDKITTTLIFNRVGAACGAERRGVGNLELPHHTWMP